MLNGLRISARGDSRFADTTAELLSSASRDLVWLATGTCVAWFYLSGFKLRDLPSTVIILLVGAASHALIARHPLAAQAVWQLGVGVAVVLAASVLGRPEVTLALVLLPLMAAATVGWPLAVLSELMVAGLVLLGPAAGILPDLVPPYNLGVILGGAFAGLLGWTVTRALLTVAQWSLFSFQQARQEMENARDQRVELKQIQQDLAHANQELARLSDRLKAMYHVAEEARRVKEEFVTNVSHELRTPLNMITGFSELMLQTPETYDGSIPASLLADLAVIHRNAEALQGLVDDVLDLSQIEAGRMALTKEHVKFQEIASAATTAVRPLYDRKGLILEIELQDDLPPVLCDRIRIREVLLNLLSNAGRHTEHGAVSLRAWREEDDLVVAVADTGPGISEDDIRKLFRPFQQLDGSTSRRFGGTGLGLAISRGFVESHGGKIWVESTEGVGSTFYFRIPLGAALAAGPGFAQWITPEWEYVQRTRPSRADRPKVPPRFVVLEKGKLLGRLLRRYWDGVEVVRVASLEEACRELGSAPSQALLINDVSVEEGLARAELVTTPFQTPVVVCSIAGIEDSLSALGVADYLVKPVAREPLLSALDRLGVKEGTILIVDDKPDALHLFGRMLASSERGYRTLLARDGEQAMRICREHPPDAMLLDLIMPNMDGFHVLRSMREDPELSDIPVVVISARDPAGHPVVSSALAVTQDRGLSAQSLLATIRAVTGVLSVAAPADDAVQPEGSSD